MNEVEAAKNFLISTSGGGAFAGIRLDSGRRGGMLRNKTYKTENQEVDLDLLSEFDDED